MKVITVGNTKGGVGKSTLATNLAVEATLAGLRVGLIDTDFPQYSTMSWRALRKKDDIFATAISKDTLHKDLPKTASAFDLVVIDSGGRDSNVFRSAIAACDLLLIPVLPSQFDIYAAGDTVKILEDSRVYKDIAGALVLNQLIPNTNVSADAAAAIADFSEKVDLLNTRLYARVAYKQAVSEGMGVSEYERGTTKSVLEIKSLFAETMKILGIDLNAVAKGGVVNGEAETIEDEFVPARVAAG